MSRMFGGSMIEAFPAGMAGSEWVREKSTKTVIAITDAMRALPEAERGALRTAAIYALTLDAWVHDRYGVAEIAVADVMARDAAEGLDLWSDLMRDPVYSERAALYRRADEANQNPSRRHWADTDKETEP